MLDEQRQDRIEACYRGPKTMDAKRAARSRRDKRSQVNGGTRRAGDKYAD